MTIPNNDCEDVIAAIEFKYRSDKKISELNNEKSREHIIVYLSY